MVRNSKDHPMIATSEKPKLTREHHQQFLAMLPAITRVARQTFSDLDAEAKEEAVAEVVATALIMFVGLVRDGREASAYPSVLAAYSIRRVRTGRQAATPRNIRDVSSMHCQLQKDVKVERLDRYDSAEEAWTEVLVEDRHAGPAETAAARIDVGEFFRGLKPRYRKVADFLAEGNTTNEAAKRFRVSASRISKMRRCFYDGWQRFQGEPPSGRSAVDDSAAKMA
jgi:hypothetical protein